MASCGWLSVVGIFLGLIMIAALLIPPVITRFDREVREQRSTRVAYGVASWALWIALLVGALSVPDEADGGALDTALTTWTDGAIDDAASGVDLRGGRGRDARRLPGPARASDRGRRAQPVGPGRLTDRAPIR